MDGAIGVTAKYQQGTNGSRLVRLAIEQHDLRATEFHHPTRCAGASSAARGAPHAFAQRRNIQALYFVRLMG